MADCDDGGNFFRVALQGQWRPIGATFQGVQGNRRLYGSAKHSRLRLSLDTSELAVCFVSALVLGSPVKKDLRSLTHFQAHLLVFWRFPCLASSAIATRIYALAYHVIDSYCSFTTALRVGHACDIEWCQK